MVQVFTECQEFACAEWLGHIAADDLGKAPGRVAGNRRGLLEPEWDGGDESVGAPAERGGEDGAALVEQQAAAELARFNLANEHQDVLTRRDLGRGQVGEEGAHHRTLR
jgi:hypothetical protein